MQNNAPRGCFSIFWGLFRFFITNPFRQTPILGFCLVAFFYNKQYIAIALMAISWFFISIFLESLILVLFSNWIKARAINFYINIFSKCEYTKINVYDYIDKDILEKILLDHPLLAAFKDLLLKKISNIHLYIVKRGNSVQFPSTLSAYGSPMPNSNSYIFVTNPPKSSITYGNYDSPFYLPDYLLRHEIGHLSYSNTHIVLDNYVKIFRPIISLISVIPYVIWNNYSIYLFLSALLIHSIIIFLLTKRRKYSPRLLEELLADKIAIATLNVDQKRGLANRLMKMSGFYYDNTLSQNENTIRSQFMLDLAQNKPNPISKSLDENSYMAGIPSSYIPLSYLLVIPLSILGFFVTHVSVISVIVNIMVFIVLPFAFMVFLSLTMGGLDEKIVSTLLRKSD